MKLIDTHCHLDTFHFQHNLLELLKKCVSLGVTDFIVPGYIGLGFRRIASLSDQHDSLHAALGLHPLYLEQHTEEHLELLEGLCSQKNVVAVGEIGLDFYHSNDKETEQRTLFEKQLDTAKKHDLPVLLHVRKAHDQVLSILRKKRFENRGIVHAFNGSRQQEDQYLALGFKLGYGGTITYERAIKIRKLAAELPLSSIVLETDAPDIPLAHRRDQINSPEYLPEILDTLAHLRKEGKDEIALQTTANAFEVLSSMEKA